MEAEDKDDEAATEPAEEEGTEPGEKEDEENELSRLDDVLSDEDDEDDDVLGGILDSFSSSLHPSSIALCSANAAAAIGSR